MRVKRYMNEQYIVRSGLLLALAARIMICNSLDRTVHTYDSVLRVGACVLSGLPKARMCDVRSVVNM